MIQGSERSYVLNLSILCFYDFVMDLGTVPIEWYFVFFILFKVK